SLRSERRPQMPSTDLKTSTEERGVSSIGALRIDSTMLWGQDPLSRSRSAYFDVTGAGEGMRVFVAANPVPASPGTQSPQVFFARGLCHWAVDRLPDRALSELLETLKTMFEFYAPPPRRRPALPPTRRVLSAKPAGRQVRRPLSFVDE